MGNNLRYYQEDAVNAIYDFYYSSSKKGKMILSSGLGRTTIISLALEKILKKSNCKVLILCSFDSAVNQTKERLKWDLGESYIINYLPDLKEKGVFLSDYKSILTTEVEIDYSQFDFIICYDLDILSSEVIYPFLNVKGNTKRLLMYSGLDYKKEYSSYKCIYRYTIKDALEDGYIIDNINEEFIVSYIYLLLGKLDYENIEISKCINIGYSYIRPDIMTSKDGKSYIFKVRSYRDLEISKNIMDVAVSDVRNYQYKLKDREYSFVLVMLCLVDDEYKKEVYEKYNIVIWDISNLLYLTSGYEDIYNLLVRSVPYFVSNIKKKKPICFEGDVEEIEKTNESKYEEFKFRLEKCPYGNDDEASREYEIICDDIVKYLFEPEFFQMSSQHLTFDRAFRMDLICSLKGTTAFWKFLIDFYRTKFVVFEYKNSSEMITQNSIFVTEKYLLSAALRNVAFIVSRKGFDRNATMMSLGSLKNDSKLIIGLTDEDMLMMVSKKEKGEEPSDYLMDKVEKILMSISK